MYYTGVQNRCTHTQDLSLSHTHTLSFSLLPSFPPSLPPSLSLSLSLSLPLSLPLSNTLIYPSVYVSRVSVLCIIS